MNNIVFVHIKHIHRTFFFPIYYNAFFNPFILKLFKAMTIFIALCLATGITYYFMHCLLRTFFRILSIKSTQFP